MNRLHPGTIGIELFKVLRQFLGPLVIFLAFQLSGRGGDSSEVLLSLFGFFALFASVARYLTTTYGIEAGHLVIRSGWFTKQTRTIPLDRIQNINLTKTVVHRFLGLVDLEVETASGSGVEARLSALGEEQAEVLRERLVGSPKTPIATESVAPALVRATTRELFLQGATENRALAIVASVFALSMTLGPAMGGTRALLGDTLEASRSLGPEWLLWFVLGTSILLVGWVLSIAAALINYGGFELRLEGSRLKRKYGMLNQVETTVPLWRIQNVRWISNPLQRWLGVGKLYADTAGSYSKQDFGGSAMLAPLIEQTRLRELAQVALPQIGGWPEVWSPVSPKAVAARFRARLLWIGLLQAALIWRFGWPWVGCLPVVLAVSYAHAIMRFRALGFAWTQGALAVRDGVWSKVLALQPRTKVQTTTWMQSPIQRRYGLASVGVQNASAHPNSALVVVPDLEEADAAKFLSSARMDAARRHALDGV